MTLCVLFVCLSVSFSPEMGLLLCAGNWNWLPEADKSPLRRNLGGNASWEVPKLLNPPALQTRGREVPQRIFKTKNWNFLTLTSKKFFLWQNFLLIFCFLCVGLFLCACNIWRSVVIRSTEVIKKGYFMTSTSGFLWPLIINYIFEIMSWQFFPQIKINTNLAGYVDYCTAYTSLCTCVCMKVQYSRMFLCLYETVMEVKVCIKTMLIIVSSSTSILERINESFKQNGKTTFTLSPFFREHWLASRRKMRNGKRILGRQTVALGMFVLLD